MIKNYNTLAMMQTFNPTKVKTLLATIKSSQNWNVPDGVTEVDVYLVGGGGAGGMSSTVGGAGGGGGGYCKLYRFIEVTPNQIIPITIGAGGNSSEKDGGTTQFGSFSVSGGKRGYIANKYNNKAGGDGGSGGGAHGGRISGSNGRKGGYNGSDGENFPAIDVLGGLGGGTIDYQPTNPYNNITYGNGGGGGGYIGGLASFDAGKGGSTRGPMYSGISARPNTGSGGGGGAACYNEKLNKYGMSGGGDGGSGICLIYG